MHDDPILILKTGSAQSVVPAALGDFEDWIGDGLGLNGSRIVVCDVKEGDPLPRPAELAGVVITGSAAMLTDLPAWATALVPWLAESIRADLPILGICFGHQLLAHAAGGEVIANPRGREIGTITVQLNDAARDDGLLAGLPAEIVVQATHVETVLRLPDAAVGLGCSDLDQYQAFCLGRHAWGVQFHPEMNAAAVDAYLRARAEVITAEGLDVAVLRAGVRESPHGRRILSNFGRIASSARV